MRVVALRELLGLLFLVPELGGLRLAAAESSGVQCDVLSMPPHVHDTHDMPARIPHTPA